MCRAPLTERTKVVFVRRAGVGVTGESGLERRDDVEPRAGCHLAHVLGAEFSAVQHAGRLKQPSRRETLTLRTGISTGEAQHALGSRLEGREVVAAFDVVVVGVESEPNNASITVGEQWVLVAPRRERALRHAEHEHRPEAGPVRVV